MDYRSDQFALGLLIYELATGTLPFDRPTPAQTLAATIEIDPPPLESLRPDVPPHLAAIIKRLLAKSPDERYESTRDLARDLKSIVETPSIAAPKRSLHSFRRTTSDSYPTNPRAETHHAVIGNGPYQHTRMLRSLACLPTMA